MADTSTTSAEATTVEPEPQQSAEIAALDLPGQPDIDIQALAEKVYRLMMAEIRLDRARGLTTADGG